MLIAWVLLNDGRWCDLGGYSYDDDAFDTCHADIQHRSAVKHRCQETKVRTTATVLAPYVTTKTCSYLRSWKRP